MKHIEYHIQFFNLLPHPCSLIWKKGDTSHSPNSKICLLPPTRKKSHFGQNDWIFFSLVAGFGVNYFSGF